VLCRQLADLHLFVQQLYNFWAELTRKKYGFDLYQEVVITIVNVNLFIEGKGLYPLRLVILASFYSDLDEVFAHSYLA
jgi:hypothetical protein